jgi:hypothetical protein
VHSDADSRQHRPLNLFESAPPSKHLSDKGGGPKTTKEISQKEHQQRPPVRKSA